MLQKEFEERTGLSICEAEYAKIDALYLACGDDIDKDEFCKLYMDFDGRLELMHRIEREHQRMKDALYEKELMHKEAMEIISDAADAVLEIGNMPEAAENVQVALERKAWWLVGRSEVIKRKAKMGITFSEEEIEYISQNLK